jgi:hypothetical protein
MSSVLDALGYPGHCLPSTSALPLSKEYRHIETCFLNIILAPYTLLASNEFETLRHSSHAKMNHTGQLLYRTMFAVELPAKFTATRQSCGVFCAAVTCEFRCRMTLFDTRRVVTLFCLKLLCCSTLQYRKQFSSDVIPHVLMPK